MVQRWVAALSCCFLGCSSTSPSDTEAGGDAEAATSSTEGSSTVEASTGEESPSAETGGGDMGDGDGDMGDGDGDMGDGDGDSGNGDGDSGDGDSGDGDGDADACEPWATVHGTDQHDFGAGLALDAAGNAYVAGTTLGAFDGGLDPAFEALVVAKFDPMGTHLWTSALANPADLQVNGIAASAEGEVYVVGVTEAELDGMMIDSGSDAFVVKYDTNGAKQWTRLIATDNADIAYSATVGDAGEVFVVGSTAGDLEGVSAGSWDSFMVKFSSEGTQLWARQFGVPLVDIAWDVALDPVGRIVVSGTTASSLTTGEDLLDRDAYVMQFDEVGVLLWAHQFDGPEPEEGKWVAVDSNAGVYIAGTTYGDFEGNPGFGGRDMFVAHIDANGAPQWSDVLGTTYVEDPGGLAVDGDGQVWVTGRTPGPLDGVPNGGGANDPYIVKYSNAGEKMWTVLLGEGEAASPAGIEFHDTAGLIFAGNAWESFEGLPTTEGGNDLFVRKFCEP